MAETFWLWWPRHNPSRSELCFFVCRANLPQLGKGTAALVSEMLGAMGWQDPAIEGFEIPRAFRSSFHAQHVADEPDQGWEDVWGLEWELIVTLRSGERPPRIVLDRCNESASFGCDETWSGEDASFPQDGLVASAFATSLQRDEARARAAALEGVLRVEPFGATRMLCWFGPIRRYADEQATAMGQRIEEVIEELGGVTRLVDV